MPGAQTSSCRDARNAARCDGAGWRDVPARTAPARRSCEQPLRPERLRAWPARSVATQSRVVGILGNGWWAESVLLDTRERSYANTVYPGGDKHALRTSCCAVATFALLVVLVVLGVACIVKSTCACHPALASEEDSCTEGRLPEGNVTRADVKGQCGGGYRFVVREQYSLS